MTAPQYILSDVIHHMQVQNRLPNIASTCEAELQELMKQIDVMFHSQKAQWEKEKQHLETTLQKQKAEINVLKATVQARDIEVQNVNLELESFKSKRTKKAQHCEKELELLRNEVTRIKEDYVKMQKKYQHHLKVKQVDFEKVNILLEQESRKLKKVKSELQYLKDKLKIAQDTSKDSEKLKITQDTSKDKCDSASKEKDISPNKNNNQKKLSLLGLKISDDDFLVDSADIATANFMAEQNRRTAELEKKLDKHIDDLTTSLDATLLKYTSNKKCS